jgi:hypothetical protein
MCKKRNEGKKGKKQRENILTGWERRSRGEGPTSHNRTVYASPPSAARATKTRSRAAPFVRFFSATFFCARKNASHFSLSGAKKRHIQPDVMRNFAQNF